MNKTSWFTLWGGLFILCAALGFLPIPDSFGRVALTALSVAFFIPPFVLLHNGDRLTAKLMRNLSLTSLLATVLLLIANFLSVGASETLGNILHTVLVIVSAPMVASGYWLLSLFLWACLLMYSLQILRKK